MWHVASRIQASNYGEITEIIVKCQGNAWPSTWADLCQLIQTSLANGVFIECARVCVQGSAGATKNDVNSTKSNWIGYSFPLKSAICSVYNSIVVLCNTWSVIATARHFKWLYIAVDKSCVRHAIQWYVPSIYRRKLTHSWRPRSGWGNAWNVLMQQLHTKQTHTLTILECSDQCIGTI